jgi:predicted lipid-binding transport protein (Tim44 family)
LTAWLSIKYTTDKYRRGIVMKKIIVPIVSIALLAGCAGAGPNQMGGAAAGAAAGGLLGSMLGGGTGRIAGAAAGAALGGLAGSAVGASMDRQNAMEQHMYQRQSAPSMGSGSNGEASAYNRGRAEYEAEVQRRREQDAYLRGRRGE